MTRELILWMFVVAAPVLWFVNLEANFAISSQFCGWGRWLSLAIGICTMGVVAMLSLLARRQLRAARDNSESALALGAAAINAIAGIVILAQTIPIFLLLRCG